MHILYFCFLILSCSNKQQCFKDLIDHNKFKDVGMKEREKGEYVFSDTSQVSYVNGALYAKATILWRSCSKYEIVVRERYYDYGLKVGDTLKVEILSYKNDTFSYKASVLGVTITAKLAKIK